MANEHTTIIIEVFQLQNENVGDLSGNGALKLSSLISEYIGL